MGELYHKCNTPQGGIFGWETDAWRSSEAGYAAVMSPPILYIKPGCPWCDEVVEFLHRKRIEVETVIVSGNPEAMSVMVALSGQTKAPTMDWHGEVLADFGVDELIPFLRERGFH
jgi:glutaredoxin